MGGQYISKLRTLYRPLKNYNVEQRAMKVISKDKPTPAPPYPSMKKIMDDIKNDPELLTKGELNPEKMKNLRQVFITSKGDNPVIVTKRDLPQDRKTSMEHLYGYEEPKIIPKGKATLHQVLEFLEKRQSDETYTANNIAKDYNLDEINVHNILTYFEPFEVYVPKKEPVEKERNPLRRIQAKMDQLKD